IITNISYDHTAILGNTLEKIAWHKAGIIKKGSAIFSSETKPAVQAVLNKEAKQFNQKVQYIQPSREYETQMPGKHQQWNAALAAAVGHYLSIDESNVEKGIAEARLPARIELMQTAPRVILDGAHSTAKIEALVHSLEQFRPWQKLHLLFAAKETKELYDLLAPLAPLIDAAYMTSFTLPGFKSQAPEEAAILLKQMRSNVPVICENDAHTALRKCLLQAAPDDMIIITGSLYLAGKLRIHWIPEQTIIEQQATFPQ
ncbi:MAG TPA: cyanophycin synthetase, partial [Patescibacteria group bacterium]|nr:cyanophycin synthetase [Patescibacteria group bacterium]